MDNAPGSAPKLSFVTLLSYDYRYALVAIRSYYEIADEIILGLDADRMTWMRKPFEIDMAEVNAKLGRLDVGRKIRVVGGNFHKTDDPLVNETQERIDLSLHCTAGNWIVQIDSDEILLNAREFRDGLIANNPKALVMARWISVFKIFGDKALVIDPPTEWAPVATRLRGAYISVRRTAEPQIKSPLQLLHFSWGRTPAELRQKLENWGHSRQFDIDGFFRFWESVTLENYRQFHNFHPIEPTWWPGLTVGNVKWIDG